MGPTARDRRIAELEAKLADVIARLALVEAELERRQQAVAEALDPIRTRRWGL